MTIIEGARCCKPFKAIAATQTMFMDCTNHFSTLFKKTVQRKKKSLSIKKARVLDYSVDHVSEVWVKYTGSEEEEWSKFPLLKKGATASLPPPDKKKYDSHLSVKASKASDSRKIVNKYVPDDHKSFYDIVQADDGSSSETDVETDESDE